MSFEELITLEKLVKVNIGLAVLKQTNDKGMFKYRLNKIGVYIDIINAEYKHNNITRIIKGIDIIKAEKDKIKVNKYINGVISLIYKIIIEIDFDKEYVEEIQWDKIDIKKYC